MQERGSCRRARLYRNEPAAPASWQAQHRREKRPAGQPLVCALSSHFGAIIAPPSLEYALASRPRPLVFATHSPALHPLRQQDGRVMEATDVHKWLLAPAAAQKRSPSGGVHYNSAVQSR